MAGLRRPTRRVKGRIGAGSLLQGARVARIAECCLEQKVGYDRHTDHLQGYSDQFLQNTDSKIFKVLWEMKKNGLKDETIKNNRKLLLYLSKHVDLSKPERARNSEIEYTNRRGNPKLLIY